MAKKDKIIAFLGQNTFFEGNLTFEGTLQIDGQYKGTISAAGSLIVGKTGRVESDIHVSSIVVNGEIHGNIVAEDSIEIRIPGRVYGNIQSPTVIIQEGVIFEGNCRTRPVKPPDDARLKLVHPHSDEPTKTTGETQTG